MKIVQPGPETFLELRDTPNDYSGAASDNVVVNGAETGLQFTPGGGGGGIGNSYETVSQNIVAYDYTITYTVDGDIDFIEYDLGGGLTVTKTFNYSGADISSIVLSGDTPGGIALTKTFTLSGGDITSVAYS